MKTDHSSQDRRLLIQARTALDCGPPPSAATLAALHAAAVEHVNRSRWSRFRGDVRRWGPVLGGLAAAAVFAVLLSPLGEPAATAPLAPPTLAGPSGLEADPGPEIVILGLLSADPDAVLADAAAITGVGGLLDALLSYQELPGAFEDAHELYAIF